MTSARPTTPPVTTGTPTTAVPSSTPSSSTTTVVATTTTTTKTIPTLPPLASPPVILRVGARSYDWVDRSRNTPANGNYRARAGRELVTTIWYPAVGSPSTIAHWGATPDRTHGPFPVILFAHGHAGEPAAYKGIITNWVSRGYVVVAPAFPLSRARALGGPTYDDVLNQPGDLSYVLTRVLADNADPDSWMHGLLDPRRVGAVGHSLGAWTVLGLVGNKCCRDRRVKAAILLASELAPAFKTKFFTSPAPPLLFVHALRDNVTPYMYGQRAYAAATAPKYFLTVLGDHLQPYWGPATPLGATVVAVTNEFLDRYVRSLPNVAIASPDERYGRLKSQLP